MHMEEREEGILSPMDKELGHCLPVFGVYRKIPITARYFDPYITLLELCNPPCLKILTFQVLISLIIVINARSELSPRMTRYPLPPLSPSLRQLTLCI